MDWPSDIFSIVLAVVLGAAIGVEREFSGKAAGLRTNILICLGAAAFTIISKRMAGEADSLTRIAAQVVTGVGFLGAGAIIQDRGGVHGLTTAATIWFVASIGVACGAALYELALIMTLLAVFVLIGLRQIQKTLSHYVERHKPKDVSDEQP
jgi:putative Mg2+ transporter-C (MgtC) family protein